MKPFPLRSRLIVPLALLLPPLFLLATVTLGNKTLLPADNLIAFEPWTSASDNLNLTASETPHNALLSDLILENYARPSPPGKFRSGTPIFSPGFRFSPPDNTRCSIRSA